MVIAYIEQYRKPDRHGVNMTVQFIDDETGSIITKTFYFNKPDPSSVDIIARMNKAINNIEFQTNPLNEIELNEIEIRELIKELVKYIRNNPTVTVTALITVIDTKYPELNWKPKKILQYIQNYLKDRLKKDFTFEQFKTYVINRKFSGVDG